MVQVAGLSNAHSSGVMHRDIKPENILIAPTGHLALADFGLSWMHEDLDITKVRLTDMTGTPGYWAPEVATVRENRDCAYKSTADIWSLGMVILEMAIGLKRPWYNQKATDDVSDVLRNMVIHDVPLQLVGDEALRDLLRQVRVDA
jgi:serine/threonine protein kinase